MDMQAEWVRAAGVFFLRINMFSGCSAYRSYTKSFMITWIVVLNVAFITVILQAGVTADRLRVNKPVSRQYGECRGAMFHELFTWLYEGWQKAWDLDLSVTEPTARGVIIAAT